MSGSSKPRPAELPSSSDSCLGLDEFFKPGEEILVARSTKEVLDYLTHISESDRVKMANRAHKRFLSQHTAGHRAAQLVTYYRQLTSSG